MFVKDTFGKVRERVEKIVGPGNVWTDNANLALNSYDSSLSRARPEAVVKITSAAQVAPLLALLHAEHVPFVPRAAATNLTGGCVPLKGGVIINIAALNRIIEIDTARGYALVEPGVVNAELQRELAREGWFFPCDPLSAAVSTVGGNIAENAAGPGAFRYGMAGDTLLEVDFVTPCGEELRWSVNDGGPMLARFFAGSEGMLGIAARLKVKILKEPRSVRAALAGFKNAREVIVAVQALLKDGITPRVAIGFDRLALSTADAQVQMVAPLESNSALLLEFTGEDSGATAALAARAKTLCEQNASGEFISADTPQERAALWTRMDVYGAMSSHASSMVLDDLAVPPSRLSDALLMMRSAASRFDVRAALIYHPADGSVHPQIVFDERNSFEAGRVKKAAYEMLRCAVSVGGTIAGGCGVGIDKRMAMSWLYDAHALELFRRIKRVGDPNDMANPDKVIPVLASRGSEDGSQRAPAAKFSDAAQAVVDELKARANASSPSSVMCLKTAGGAGGGYAKPLALAGMDSLLDVDPGNRMLSAEAGVKARFLAEAAKEAGLKLELPDYPGSIGGLIASGMCPGLRPFITGMRFAMADGTVISVGGKCVKDPPGPDLISLLCGSRGTFAVLLSVTLRADGALASPALVERREFVPSQYHRRLKEAFDPNNLLNPHVYGTQDETAKA
jgi:glycolate oxidase